MPSRAPLAVAAVALLAGAAAVAWYATRHTPEAPPPTIPAPAPPAAPRPAPPPVPRGPEAVKQLRARVESAPDGIAKQEALKAAASLGSEEAVRWLAEVASKDPDLGAHAGAALGSVASSSAAPELVRVLRSDAPVIARANAARALGASGREGDAVTLSSLAADDAQPERVRQEAALAAGKLGAPAAVPALAAALERPGAGEQLRISLIQALGAIDSPEATAALERHAKERLGDTEKVFLEQALDKRRAR